MSHPVAGGTGGLGGPSATTTVSQGAGATPDGAGVPVAPQGEKRPAEDQEAAFVDAQQEEDLIGDPDDPLGFGALKPFPQFSGDTAAEDQRERMDDEEEELLLGTQEPGSPGGRPATTTQRGDQTRTGRRRARGGGRGSRWDMTPEQAAAAANERPATAPVGSPDPG